jgi:hypothetical protein
MRLRRPQIHPGRREDAGVARSCQDVQAAMSATNPLARAVLDALRSDPETCDELRVLLGTKPQPAPRDDGWLDSTRAAEYLGITKSGCTS